MSKLYSFRSGVLLFLWLCILPVMAQNRENEYLSAPMPATWTTDSLFIQTLPADDRWWQELNDPVLDSLIMVAVANNHNLLVAADRIRIAKAALRMQQSYYYPGIDFSAGWTKSRQSGNLVKGGNPNDESQYASADLSVSWEIDLFGSIRQRAKSQKELYRASREEYNGAMVTLCAQVAQMYAALRTYQQQYLVAERNIASQKVILHITEVRHNTGLASMLDVSQASTVYYSTVASLPSLKAAIDKQINALAVLLGLYPSELREALIHPAPLPEYYKLVSVGIPLNIIRRRPDVRSAEYTVASYAAAAGAAKSDFLPKLYLKGSVGFAARDMDHFFKKKSFTYQIAPTLTWILFQGMERTQALVSAKAQLDAGIEQYNQTVLTAVQEVENAMTGYSHAVEQISSLQQLVAQGTKTLDLSLDLYKRGLSNFQNVLDAQRSLLSYQNSLVSAQGGALNSLISLYEALGGGWESEPNR